MTIFRKSLKIISWILFSVYFIALTKNVLFKKSFPYYKNYFNHEYKKYKVKDGWEKVNTKPFTTIRLFYNSRRMNSEYKKYNLLGNFAGFIPLGLLLPFIFPRLRNLYKILVAGFILSLFFESMQLIFNLGVFDVDDLILNTVGALAGYIIFIPLHLLFKNKREVLT